MNSASPLYEQVAQCFLLLSGSRMADSRANYASTSPWLPLMQELLILCGQPLSLSVALQDKRKGAGLNGSIFVVCVGSWRDLQAPLFGLDPFLGCFFFLFMRILTDTVCKNSARRKQPTDREGGLRHLLLRLKGEFGLSDSIPCWRCYTIPHHSFAQAARYRLRIRFRKFIINFIKDWNCASDLARTGHRPWRHLSAACVFRHL